MLVNLDPLISEIKQFNLAQTLILQELKEIKQLLQKHAINNSEQKG